jgi:hypothetical protein
MTIALTNVTGGAQTGFTTPGYTITTDIYPGGVNGKQWAVTTLTGTQSGVRSHAVSDPFTIAFTRPANPSVLQSPNPVTGRYGNIPKNGYSVVARKGVNYAANQTPSVAFHRGYWDIPAGADAYDAPNVRALASLVVGAYTQQSAGFGDTLVTGIL